MSLEDKSKKPAKISDMCREVTRKTGFRAPEFNAKNGLSNELFNYSNFSPNFLP